MKKMIPVLLVLLPALAFAAEGGHEEVHGAHGGGLPLVLWYQTFNFVLYAGLLFFILRKPVKLFFRGRREGFNEALVKAQAAKHEAEHKKNEIQKRLTTLEETTEESLQKARAEAHELKAKIIQEAAELSKRLREEAHRTAEIEIDRAKTELRAELLLQSLEISRTLLSQKMAETDQKRLQTESLDKMQAVH